MANNRDNYVNAIGEIVIKFNMLERFLLAGIFMASNIDKKLCTELFGSEDFLVKLKTFDVVVRHKITDTTLLIEFGKLISKLDNLNTNRNKYLHSYWHFDKTNLTTEISKYTRKSIGTLPHLYKEPVDMYLLKVFDGNITFGLIELDMFIVDNFMKNKKTKNMSDNLKKLLPKFKKAYYEEIKKKQPKTNKQP